jgi:phosphoenolpyruvate carboxykinase (GTP)
MRVLKWIVDRCHGRVSATKTPIGWIPQREDLNWSGLENFSPGDFEALQKIDPAEWSKELESQQELFAKLGDRMPKELVDERERLLARIPVGDGLPPGRSRPG